MKLFLLFEAGMNRRDFLKFVGKAGAAAAGAPLDKLGLGALGKLEKLASQPTKIPIRIDFFPANGTYEHPVGGKTYPTWRRTNLSGDFDTLTKAFMFFKNLIGSDIYNQYDYGEYAYLKKMKVDLPELIKKWSLKGGEPQQEGMYWGNTPFGTIQVTDQNVYRHHYDLDDPDDPSELLDYDTFENLVVDPIKAYWDQVGHHIISSYNLDKKDFIDEEALQKLEDSGIDSENVVAKRERHNASVEADKKKWRDKEEKAYYHKKD